MIEAKLENVAVAGDGNQFLVLLKTADGDILPIVIGPLEAMSIAAGRAKESAPRPMTHDLLLSILGLLNVQVKRVEITDLTEGTFYAKLILDNRGIEFEVDSRPSDALALIARTDAPLFVAQSVIDQAALSDFGSSGGVEA
jgi:bifunctional DNase/RNase